MSTKSTNESGRITGPELVRGKFFDYFLLLLLLLFCIYAVHTRGILLLVSHVAWSVCLCLAHG